MILVILVLLAIELCCHIIPWLLRNPYVRAEAAKPSAPGPDNGGHKS